jgi:hypothetical protein
MKAEARLPQDAARHVGAPRPLCDLYYSPEGHFSENRGAVYQIRCWRKLGLRLVKQTRSIPVIVVDQVNEKPRE